MQEKESREEKKIKRNKRIYSKSKNCFYLFNISISTLNNLKIYNFLTIFNYIWFS